MKTGWISNRAMVGVVLANLGWGAGSALASGPFREVCEREQQVALDAVRRLRVCVQTSPELMNRSGSESPPSACQSLMSAWLVAESQLHRCSSDLPLRQTGEK